MHQTNIFLKCQISKTESCNNRWVRNYLVTYYFFLSLKLDGEEKMSQIPEQLGGMMWWRVQRWKLNKVGYLHKFWPPDYLSTFYFTLMVDFFRWQTNTWNWCLRFFQKNIIKILWESDDGQRLQRSVCKGFSVVAELSLPQLVRNT